LTGDFDVLPCLAELSLVFLGVPTKSLAETFLPPAASHHFAHMMTACRYLPLAPLGDVTSELTCFLLAPVSNSSVLLSLVSQLLSPASGSKKREKKKTKN
jgi:hypothetical protein